MSIKEKYESLLSKSEELNLIILLDEIKKLYEQAKFGDAGPNFMNNLNKVIDSFKKMGVFESNSGESFVEILKKAALAYFKKMGVAGPNFVENLNNQIELFSGPVTDIIDSFLVTISHASGGSDIFVDEATLRKDPLLIIVQIIHELLHALSRCFKNEMFFHFGHPRNNMFTGVDEAATQMFAEDLLGYRLDEKRNYLYFIENILRITKVIFGSKMIADQYFQNSFDNNFENNFNAATNNRFDEFVDLMNNVYILSKKRYYQGNDEKSDGYFEQKLLDIIDKLITISKKSDPTLLDRIREEVGDESFLNQLTVFSEDPKGKK